MIVLFILRIQRGIQEIHRCLGPEARLQHFFHEIHDSAAAPAGILPGACPIRQQQDQLPFFRFHGGILIPRDFLPFFYRPAHPRQCYVFRFLCEQKTMRLLLHEIRAS